MKCLRCGGAMKSAKENYKYAESGLSCVTLIGMEVSRCAACGETEAAIPAVEDLHRAIARFIILKLARLVPEEIRFLRKHLGLSQVDLSGILGVASENVSRWENGKAEMNVPTERLLRFLVASKEPVEKYEQELNRVAVGKAKCSKLEVRRKDDDWRVAAKAA